MYRADDEGHLWACRWRLVCSSIKLFTTRPSTKHETERQPYCDFSSAQDLRSDSPTARFTFRLELARVSSGGFYLFIFFIFISWRLITLL